MPDRSRTTQRRLTHAASYAFLLLVGATMLVPLLWMVATALNSPTADILSPTKWWPEKLHWENFRTVWAEIDAVRGKGTYDV